MNKNDFLGFIQYQKMTLKTESLKVLVNTIKNSPPMIRDEILNTTKEEIAESIQETVMNETTNILPDLINDITGKMLSNFFDRNSIEYQFIEPYVLEIAIEVSTNNVYIIKEYAIEIRDKEYY